MNTLLEETILPPVSPQTTDDQAPVPTRQACLVGPDGERQVIDDDLYRALLGALRALRSGHAVTISSLSTSLTTQAAADMLGISRPTLVRLLDRGEIPYTRPGRHRRVRLADVLDYRDRERQRRRGILVRMARDGAATASNPDANRFVKTR